MFGNTVKSKVGDCDCCTAVEVVITLAHHDMWQCKSCFEKDKATEAQIKQASAIIEQSRKVDASILTKADIFNAETVAAIELEAAFLANESKSEEQNRLEYAEYCKRRTLEFQQSVFSKRQGLIDEESRMMAWKTRTQDAAGKLRLDLREGFKSLDISYQPVKPKSIKSATVPSKKSNLDEVKRFALQFNVDAATVQMLVKWRHMSPEAAAKHVAESEAKAKTN